jgi:hypothetical protein
VQPDLLEAMLAEVADRHGTDPVAAMVRLADVDEPSACCIEYEAYAEWTLRRRRRRVRELRWGNVAVSRSTEVPINDGVFSVSRHNYIEA